MWKYYKYIYVYYQKVVLNLQLTLDCLSFIRSSILELWLPLEKRLPHPFRELLLFYLKLECFCYLLTRCNSSLTYLLCSTLIYVMCSMLSSFSSLFISSWNSCLSYETSEDWRVMLASEGIYSCTIFRGVHFWLSSLAWNEVYFFLQLVCIWLSLRMFSLDSAWLEFKVWS